MSREQRAAGLVILAACAYGTLAIGTTLADRNGVGLVTLMAWRYLLAAPVLIIAAGGFRRLAASPVRALGLLLLGGGGQTAVTWLSLSALEWISAASLGFLFYTYPAWLALLAAAIGLERLTTLRVSALVLALLGITLMIGAPWSTPMPLPGVVRALGAAFLYAGYVPLLHWMRGPLDAAVASTYVIAGAALMFLGLAGSGGGLVSSMTPATWGIALVLATFSTAVAFIAFLRGLEVLGPVRTAILSTVEPFWTALIAALVLGQRLSGATLAGGATIILAIMLLQYSGRPAIPDAPPPE